MPGQTVFQVNSFTSELFDGNPALVCPLDAWLDDALMQKIARESGLTCAFFVGGDGCYRIRWFTPDAEIGGICGHGTLAAASVIANELSDPSDEIAFQTAAGDLRARADDGAIVLDLPSLNPEPQTVSGDLAKLFGSEPEAVLGALDLLVVLTTEDQVESFEPDLPAMTALPKRAVIVTAPGGREDFVSRWFGPKQGEGEDTGITGSAHCMLVPYWARRLGKSKLIGRQLSPRGGVIACELHENRVWLRCSARTYMRGELLL